MIRGLHFLPGTQDLLCRRVYVIRPKPALLHHLAQADPSRSAEDTADLNSPTVVMTEEVPYERDLEGWRSAIRDKCKQAFVSQSLAHLPAAHFDLPADLLTNMATLTAFFDRWWDAKEAESIEIVGGSWKTSLSTPPPLPAPDPDPAASALNTTHFSPNAAILQPGGTLFIPAGGYAEGTGPWDGYIQIPPHHPDHLFWQWLIPRWPYHSPLSHQDLPQLRAEHEKNMS